MIEEITRLANEFYPEVREIREHLHRYPELSFQEHETMKFVCSKLEEYGIEYESGIAGTGVVAFIRGKHSDQDSHVLLRADLDALPIHEENSCEYKSTKDGIMHACGHDVHTANLLGTAKILKTLEADLVHPVQLIFQPGEEKAPGGASIMIEEGVLNMVPVKGIYGLHVFPEFEAGNVGFKSGLYMASCDEIHIELKGVGGHAAMPHQCKDPILAGTQLMQELTGQLYKSCDPKTPMVLSFGHFEAIGATNVIPSTATIKGTFRTMNETWRKNALEKISIICSDLHARTGVKAELKIVHGYPYLENNPDLTEEMRLKAQEILGDEAVHELPIRLTAEDFSFYSQKVPACFFRLGIRNEKNNIVHGVHHPRFDIDPESLKTGMKVMSMTAF